MKPGAIEPGLIPAFRFLVGLRTLLLTLALLLRSVGLPAELASAIEAPLLPGGRALVPFDLALSLLVLGYLWWRGLERRLGRAYLPIALAAVSAALIVVGVAAVASEASVDPSGAAAVRRAGRLVFQLSVPVILTAWQYGFAGVLVFSAVTTGLEVGLLRVALPSDQRPFLLAAGMSLVRVALFFLIGYLVHRLAGAQRAQRSALARANRELSRYAAALEELAVSRERNRLARELHDTLAHSLSALAVQLEGLRAVWDSNPREAGALLDRSLETARQGLIEARRAIRELRASPVEGLGLSLALRQLAEAAAERGRFELELAVAERVDLSPQAEQGLYRIAEEALANAARHAGARRVSLRLERLDGGVRLSVRDDGSGFESGRDAEDGHYGLQGMRERARLIGGTLEVDSLPGAGTTVRVTMGERR